MNPWPAGNVHRWHNNSNHALRNSNDTTWAHSARVAALLYHLMPGVGRHLILCALFHDAPEVETGDTPGPAKNGPLRDALDRLEHDYMTRNDLPMPQDERERMSLKMVDKLDAYLWARSVYASIVEADEWQKQLDSIVGMAYELGCVEKVMEVLGE